MSEGNCSMPYYNKINDLSSVMATVETVWCARLSISTVNVLETLVVIGDTAWLCVCKYTYIYVAYLTFAETLHWLRIERVPNQLLRAGWSVDVTVSHMEDCHVGCIRLLHLIDDWTEHGDSNDEGNNHDVLITTDALPVAAVTNSNRQASGWCMA